MAAQVDQPSEDSAVQAVTIPEAARALALSVVAVRRRLKRSELRGQKVPPAAGFEWCVLVPSALVDATPTEPDQGSAQGCALPEAAGADRRLVAVLQARLAGLREEPDARRREVRGLHVLLARHAPWKGQALRAAATRVRDCPLTRTDQETCRAREPRPRQAARR